MLYMWKTFHMWMVWKARKVKGETLACAALSMRGSTVHVALHGSLHWIYRMFEKLNSRYSQNELFKRSLFNSIFDSVIFDIRTPLACIVKSYCNKFHFSTSFSTRICAEEPHNSKQILFGYCTSAECFSVKLNFIFNRKLKITIKNEDYAWGAFVRGNKVWVPH